LFVLLLCFALIVPAGTVHSAQVVLVWDRNTETDIAGYRVYYGTASRAYNWFFDVGNVTTYNVTGLTDGSTYYFAATAYDTLGLESTYSAEANKSTCTYSISPPSQSFTASAGTGTVSVSTQSTCPWTAASGVSWLTITSGSSGTGNGMVRYSVSANTSSTSRSVSSTIAKSVFTVTQAGTSGSAYTIIASAGDGGTISPSGSVAVAQGGGKAFIIAANTGYQISSVTVDGVSQGAVSSYTFSNVTANHTISASFKSSASAGQVTLEANYSVDIKNNGTKYYHDGNDWVGRDSSGIFRTVNRWDISGINPSWKIVSVEVRFYTESKVGSTGALSINRYGSSHGEDNPQTDTGAQVYSKSAGSAYASWSEPSSGSWTNWVNLRSTAVSDIAWCRDNGKTTWSVGLKASSTVESSTTVTHVNFSEDNETNDAELRITYTP
jgi:hypothetical protein